MSQHSSSCRLEYSLCCLILNDHLACFKIKQNRKYRKKIRLAVQGGIIGFAGAPGMSGMGGPGGFSGGQNPMENITQMGTGLPTLPQATGRKLLQALE